MSANILIVPGIGDSGPQHWQTLWQKANPAFVRVQQENWDTPDCSDWISNLEKAVNKSGKETVLVAHSLGCLLVANWAAQTALQLKAALLVAPPDPENANFPNGTKGFAPFSHKQLPFRSILAASSNDPYGSIAFNRTCAESWGSEFILAGALGHINAESPIGEWLEGLELLKKLTGAA